MKGKYSILIIIFVLLGFISFLYFQNRRSQQITSIATENSTAEAVPSVEASVTPCVSPDSITITSTQTLLPSPVATKQAKDEKYVSISDLYNSTPREFSRSVSTFGRQIEINAPVYMPEATSLPILVVQGGTVASSFKSISLTKNIGKLNTSKQHMYCEDGIAQAVPTLPNQVFPAIEAILQSHESIAIVSKGQVAFSRGYASAYSPGDALPSEVKDKEYAYVDIEKPISDAGYYLVSAMQKVEGIAVFDNFYFIVQFKSDPKLPSPYIKAYYYDDENYDISGMLVKSYDVIINDVPLLAFDRIESVIDYYIQAGMLRSIYDMTFGYMILCTDDDNQYVTIPVWQIRGEIFPDSNSEHNSWYNSWTGEQYYNRQIGGDLLRINAQTGEVLDRQSEDLERYYAGFILTWGDVQEDVQ